MEESKRYIRLGLFVVVCLTILFAVLFLLGGRKLFQPTFTFETYFNESVAGLDVGAPVRFRGVPLGQVSEILTSAAAYERGVPLDKGRQYIVVRAKINLSANEVEQLKHDAIPMVERGLRAQTQLAGVTGQQYLAIDFFDPAQFPPLEFPWTPKFVYLPSAPSLTGQIVANAQAFLASLNEADVKTLGRSLNTLIVDLDNKLSEAPVEKLIKNANATIERIDAILAAAPVGPTLRKLDAVSGRLDALLADPGFEQTVDNLAGITARLRKLADDGDLDHMITRIDATVERLDALIGDNQYDARVIVQDLRVTADNLRTVSETVKRYPAGALVGGPPDKVQLPGNSR
jgi:phospholipid/cholesterol/gamma-HCH transport system substrate-binding protein/paraquat-inducible protein B